jgi:ssDNA-binding replication factor A large subunit
MLMGLTYDEIVAKIKEKGLSQEEVDSKVKLKLEQLSGLISKEGAAQIIANELGVKIFRDVGKLKVNEIKMSMRDIEVDGKVIVVYDIRNFKTEKREGRVASFMIGDETGQIRIVVWDEGLIKKVEIGEIKEGVILKIKNTYCRDNNGFKELHLNDRSEVVTNPEGVSIEKVVNSAPVLEFSHKKINELSEQDRNVTLRGTVVQLFDPRFYEICDNCGKRALQENGSFKCKDHGEVNVKFAVVLNLFFDDGTDTIRIACFRDAAANVLGKNEDELSSLRENPAEFEMIKTDILGKQLEINGRINKNEMFNRLEFVANNVEELNPEKLLRETT